jgi:hypothetical protein
LIGEGEAYFVAITILIVVRILIDDNTTNIAQFPSGGDISGKILGLGVALRSSSVSISPKLRSHESATVVSQEIILTASVGQIMRSWIFICLPFPKNSYDGTGA